MEYSLYEDLIDSTGQKIIAQVVGANSTYYLDISPLTLVVSNTETQEVTSSTITFPNSANDLEIQLNNIFFVGSVDPVENNSTTGILSDPLATSIIAFVVIGFLFLMAIGIIAILYSRGYLFSSTVTTRSESANPLDLSYKLGRNTNFEISQF